MSVFLFRLRKSVEGGGIRKCVQNMECFILSFGNLSLEVPIKDFLYEYF